ncbi:MAG: DUF1176 domain-containing protein [Myxococcota bacterium]
MARLLCLIVAGCTVVACASEPTPEQTSGDEDPIEEQESAEDAPAMALRGEDAVGFARMDPSLEECSMELEVEPETWRIGPNTTMVWVPCELGAYQPTGALFLITDEGETERLALPYWDGQGTMLSEYATGLFQFDPNTGVAEDLIRYRGVGDCGRRLRYEVSSAGLTLLEHREQSCDTEGVLPDEWPVRYPTP